MKTIKLILSIILMAFTAMVNATTTYYVDGSKADDTGNGQSWATAKKTFSAASALATVVGDNIFVKAGTYNYSNGTSATGAFTTAPNINIYGGFFGSESTQSERATSDLDGNGIIEPWEFTNQTVLNFTLTNGANGIATSNTSTQTVFCFIYGFLNYFNHVPWRMPL